MKISNLTGRLDAANLNGDLLFAPSASPRLSGELNIGSVLLDGYLPAANATPPASKEAGHSQAKAGNGSAALAQNTGEAAYTPPALELDLALNLSSIKLREMQFENIQTKLTGKQAVYKLELLNMDFAATQWHGHALANLQEQKPALRCVVAAKQIAVEQVLKGLTGKEQIIGRLDLNADVTGSAFNTDALLKSLGGKIQLAGNGNLKNFKLPQISRAQGSGIKQLETVDARINSFSASFNGAGGIFHNNDLVFDTSMGRGKGAGSINAGNASMNYLVTIETNSVNLPVRISGPFSRLEYTLDLEAMLQDPANLRRQAEKLLEEKGSRLNEKFEREIGRGLGKLFGN